ncbi:MAG TPA: SUF system NifU family Fe-S cluster assembly protein [Symbiobacteriaceae bacterium]
MSLEAQHPVNLNALYQEVILDHFKRPRNKGTVENPVVKKHLHNPTCGDDVEVQVSIGPDGRIDQVKWQGRGCSISMASASMMSQALRGKTLEEAKAFIQSFFAMMKSEPGDYRSLGEIQALQGVSKFPVRIKCATLAWHCLEEGLKEQGGGSASGS